jgi:hypothetical protein
MFRMTKKGWFAVPAAAALLALAAACGGQPFDVGSFGVDGTWKGTTRLTVGPDTATYVFVMKLSQNRSSVTGSGSVTSAADSVKTAIVGVWAYPAVTLNLTAAGYGGLQFASSFASPDTLKGILNGSGFHNDSLRIIRQH